MHRLLLGPYGYARPWRTADPELARAIDRQLDAGLRPADRIGSGIAQRLRLLVLIVSDPTRAAHVERLCGRLTETSHEIVLRVDARKDAWKFVKINEAAAGAAREFDWLIVLDDDVDVATAFLDSFIALAEAAELVIAQPAHRIHSFASYAVTQRVEKSLVRRTRFVEIGAIFAIHGRVLPMLHPFPLSSSGWGIDFLWADMARRNGWRIGVVDGAPFEHLKPIAANYSIPGALAEANELLSAHDPQITREEMLGPGIIVVPA